MLGLAIRHMLQRTRQTIVTTLGVFLGATAFVVISAYTLGLEDFFKDRLLDNDGHIRISAKEDFITVRSVNQKLYPDELVYWQTPPSGRRDQAKLSDPVGWYQRLKSDPRIEAYAPQLVSQVLLSRASGESSATLFGVDPLRQSKVTPRIARSMIEGKFSNLEVGGNRIVLGRGLKEKLGLQLGDTVMVSTGLKEAIPFKVVGFFLFGLENLDKANAYTHIADLQALSGRLSQINEIAIRLYDRDKAAEVAAAYEKLEQDRVRSWDQINETFVAIITAQTAFRFLVIGVLALVIAFGIFNILNISVVQKKKDIAILRAMGFSQFQVVTLFLYQGLVIGCVGGVFGLLLGHYVCLYLSTVQFSSSSGNVSISFAPSIYISSFLIGLTAAALAAYLPARQAGKMTPIKVIREGAE